MIFAFPNLRFPEFEGEWEKKKLGDIVKNISSGKSKNITSQGKYPFFGSTGIISYSNQSDYSGDKILIARVGANAGFIYKVKDNYAVSDNALILDVKNEKSLDFIFYYLLKFNLNKLIFGSGQPLITGGQLKSIEITFPLIEEQKKTSTFLSLIDSRIQTQKKIIEQLETLMKASREKLFSQKLRFKDEHGNDFLAWERKKIKEILTIGSGKDYKHLNDGAIPVYGTGGVITFVDSFLYDGETVCIGRKGTIDKPLYFNGKIWTVDTLFYTHSFNNSVPKFVFNIFQNINWKEYNEASGVPSLSKNTIEKIEISLPCLEEQYKITSFLSSIQGKIGTEKQILEKLELHKKFLLTNLFA